jgi:homoserine O-acetyltransferase
MTAVDVQIPHYVRDDRLYELVGPADAPVVVALGGISASRQARSWWPAIVHEGGAIDLACFRVLGTDYIDGGEGPDLRPARAVTTHDQADVIAEALDTQGIERVHTLVGASYGGMVALAFAERYPERVEQLVVISAPARAHPMAVALRSIQRQIVELALDAGRAGEGLALARQLAVTTYRSAEEFGQRFDAESVLSYLRHQGDKFARRFSAARYLALSHSVDTHAVDPSRITTPATLVAARGDAIVPLEQMQELADTLSGPSVLRVTQTFTGHDAFLAEPQAVGAIIRNALLNPLS